MSSLVDNIKKVKDAFAKIKTALTGKGVTVPEDAKLSDVPALVEDCGKKPLCTFEITYTDGTTTAETVTLYGNTSGVGSIQVPLAYRFKDRSTLFHVRVSPIADEYYSGSDGVRFAYGGDLSHIFSGCSSLASADLEGLRHAAGLTSLVQMFDGCASIVSVSLDMLEPAEGANIPTASAEALCRGCSSLTAFKAPPAICITSFRDAFNGCTSLASVDLSGMYTEDAVSASRAFYGCASLISISFSNQIIVSDATECFRNCTNLETVDFDSNSFVDWGASASYMFADCTALKSLSLHGGFAGNSSMEGMFYKCKNMKSLDLQVGFGEYTGNMSYMFSYLSRDISRVDLELKLPTGFGSNATNMKHMFSRAHIKSLIVPEGFGKYVDDASNMFNHFYTVTDASLVFPADFGSYLSYAYSMFEECDVKHIEFPDGCAVHTSRMGNMFYHAVGGDGPKSILMRDGFGQSAQSMYSMFYGFGGKNLTLPSGFGGSCTDMEEMFKNSIYLETLYLPEGFGKVAGIIKYMFNGCYRLTKILPSVDSVLEDDGSNGILNFGDAVYDGSLDVSQTALDKESLIRVIKSLQTVTSTKILILGTTLKAKLEGDDNADGAAALALAASKGWTIA